MELIEIKTLRMFIELKVIDSLNAVRDEETLDWKLLIKMKDGREIGVRTATKHEKTYKKFDTLIDQVEDMLGCPLQTLKVL